MWTKCSNIPIESPWGFSYSFSLLRNPSLAFSQNPDLLSSSTDEQDEAEVLYKQEAVWLLDFPGSMKSKQIHSI